MKTNSFFIIIAISITSFFTNVKAHDKQQTKDIIATIIKKVTGIACSKDLKIIITNIQNLKGIKTCKTVKSGKISSLAISYDAKVVSEKEINNAIETTGTCEDPNARLFKVKT